MYGVLKYLDQCRRSRGFRFNLLDTTGSDKSGIMYWIEFASMPNVADPIAKQITGLRMLYKWRWVFTRVYLEDPQQGFLNVRRRERQSFPC
jgi:hypothetical protein